MSAFWFAHTRDLIPNHCLSVDRTSIRSIGALGPRPIKPCCRALDAGAAGDAHRRRVRRARLPGGLGLGRVPGDGQRGACGVRCRPGWWRAQQLPEPIFTPTTKAETATTSNMTFATLVELVGRGDGRAQVRLRSLARLRARGALRPERGIIIADTKFEFGRVDGELHPDRRDC